MKAPTVKICGLTDYETLAEVSRLEVDHIGFVFAPSRRRVTPAQAGIWLSRLKGSGRPPERAADDEAARTTFLRRDTTTGDADNMPHSVPKAVGVFVSPDREELEAVMSEVHLEVVQLHTPESPEFCRWIKERFGVQVFRAVSIHGQPGELEGSHDAAADAPPDAYSLFAPYEGVVDAFLLDTYDPEYGGGSGRTFPWEAVPAFREAAHRLGMKLIVAGGLTPDNVERLIRDYRPDGVDVSSGIETDGAKDIAKIKAFVERVRLA